MIAKNIKGKSFKGCVQYVMNETAELLEADGVLADTAEDMIRSFAMQRSGRKEMKRPVGHIPISFAPEDRDRLTNDFMVQLAKEYMQEMGIKDTQYIIIWHHNTDNEHLHIVYNRINYKLGLIPVNDNYKRNIETCKKLKNKHGLTYGKSKERVNREKLHHPDKAKYYIYDAIKSVLPNCKVPADLRFGLQKFGIELEYKRNRKTNEIEGVSFRYNNVSFKGSQVYRKFSYGNLKKVFQENIDEAKRKGREELERERQNAKQTPATKSNLAILGVELTPEQEATLKEGGYIYLENMTTKDGKTRFSGYAFLNDEKNKMFFSKENPDTFVKYDKYEMRIRDKVLIENGYVTQAKVKWYGMGNYAYPYLWKGDKSDSNYKESWDDPRLPKPEKSKKQQTSPKIPKKNRGKKM